MRFSSEHKKTCVALLLLAACGLWILCVSREVGAAQNHVRSRKENRQQGRVDRSMRSETITIPADSPQLMNLKTEVVRTARIPGLEITAPGRIVFDVGRVSRILMPAPGRIDRVMVRLGDRVTPGQLLLTIDSPDAEGAVAECRQAESAAIQMRSALAKAQADHNRIVDLFEHQAVARKDVLAAEHELAHAGAAVEHAEAALAHCRRRLEILGLRPNETGQKLPVRTTLGGKVIDMSVTPGEYRSDMNAPLMTVADLGTVWVTSEIPEISIRFIEVGERVQVELLAYPGEIFDARVTRIADTVDPKTRTVQVQAELPNPGGRLRPEMFGRIRHSHPPRQLPVIPAQAIVQTPSGSVVFVERGPGKFQRIFVQTGEPAAGGVPVLKGIQQGDRVVVRGNMLLEAEGCADMLDALLHFSLRQRLLVILLALGLSIAGIWAYSRLKVEAYPDVSETQVIVITLMPGLAAEEIEQQVTIPIERALQSVPQAVSRRSRTIFGLSVVDLTFAYGTEDSFARQAVLEKLRDLELPDGSTPKLAPPTTPAGELYRYVVEAEALDEVECREIQDWVIAPRLSQIPGVGDVFAFGGLVKQYQIEVDPFALYRYGLTIRQIAEAVDANNRNAGGGLVSSGQQAMVIRGVGLLRSVSDLERVIVCSSNGVPVFVRDIGKVSIGAAPRTGIFGLDSRSGLVEGVVAMRRGDNPSEVLRGVREAVDELNATLPEGVRIAPIYDRTELISNTLHTVAKTLAEGLIIVLAVLLLFLGSVRAALLAAITIPLSLLFAFICMYLVGIPANLLSLGAIDFGIIVDGTLVMVVHILRRLSGWKAEGCVERPLDAVRKAASEIEKPVVFSLIIIISAYLPLFGLERVERRLFTPTAYTICFALLGSLLLAVAFVPALATYLFTDKTKYRTNRFLVWMEKQYIRLLRRLVHRALPVATAIIALAAGVFLIGRGLGSEFLPQLDEGLIWVKAMLPPGIAIEESAEIAARMRGTIHQVPEVAFVSSQTGRQDSNTEPFGPNRNELLIGLKPYSTWGHGRTKAALITELETRLRSGFPNISFNFTQPIIDMVTEAVTGSSADLAVIFTGPDLTELRRLAARALEIVRRIPGAADSSIEQDVDQAQLRITIDRQEIARYGLNVADVHQVIELAVGGRSVSTMYEGDRRFDITVRYAPEARNDASSISKLLVVSPEGARIPLAQLASISVEEGASIITRRENRRQISVCTNIRGRDQGSFVYETQQKMADQIKLPPGYRIEWGGQFENLSRARGRLAVILPLTIALMFGLLFFAFESMIDACLVLLNVPLSLIGGILALLLRGIPLSVSAAVGFVSVFGVAVMTGVLFIAELNRIRSESNSSIEEALIEAARARMAPNFLLILVALIGMVPAALATGIGSDIQRPMATVIVGGLLSTLVLTLIAMPIFYHLVSKRRKP